jgi:hypothetical protein
MVFAIEYSMRTLSVQLHTLYSTILKESPEGEGFTLKEGDKRTPFGRDAWVNAMVEKYNLETTRIHKCGTSKKKRDCPIFQCNIYYKKLPDSFYD